MTLDKFRDAYREAAKKLPKIHLDAGKVQDELHHYKMMQRKRMYLITKGCAAAAVLILCGVGTVAAKNYQNGIIQVNDAGFTITSQKAADEGSRLAQGKITGQARILEVGGGASIESEVPDIDNEAYGLAAADDRSIAESIDAEEIDCEFIEYEIEEYFSLEQFLAEESIAVAIPDIKLLREDFTSEKVLVTDQGREVFMMLANDNAVFSLTQLDNREYESYSSATTFGGQSRNERSFTNSQGLNYVMFDTVSEVGELESVHAVISVNGRDLCISFRGFDEEVIEGVLSALDLTVYFQED